MSCFAEFGADDDVTNSIPSPAMYRCSTESSTKGNDTMHIDPSVVYNALTVDTAVGTVYVVVVLALLCTFMSVMLTRIPPGDTVLLQPANRYLINGHHMILLAVHYLA